jgi:hypothetical protein
VVRRALPHRVGAAVAADVAALGCYGYQSSRIAPLIAAAGLLPLLLRTRTRRTTIALSAAGMVGFAIVIAPLAFGFQLHPDMLFGRAHSTSWLQQSVDMWPALAAPSMRPLRCTIAVIVLALGTGWCRRSCSRRRILRPPEAGCASRTASTSRSIAAPVRAGERCGRRGSSSS